MLEFSDACKVVCEKFKINSFNHHQNQAFIALVGEEKDVFVNPPTGFGKSFIYQAFPLIFDEITGVSGHDVVVISPLLNLIQDQINNLQKLGISAVSLSALKGDEEGLEDSIKDVENGRFSVVYATPEASLLNERWRSMLASPLYRSIRLCAESVDEAHVIKQC
ncbi:putative ATP-dependent DNA helicase Q1 [Montipora capricornis]|uniref:putative ATP-dependent DNA helicase Q1 n=1 Tax=Montipora capricornis TaxID=246305 RepID=UPI0035F1D48B